MIAVIFEVLPAEGHYSRYLELAAALKPQLTNIDGFISIERFQSISEPKKILSLSFWRDEAAVQQWRNQELHRSVQQQGRSSVFTDYRLRVASVIRDYGMFDREQAPQDSRDAHKENAHE
ncbi:Antibiotic biosynthesis monooxygenase [Cedecea neteri]|uniref:Antibiotic biosynthesis monooxygenase n=1 Tax=Cedecea neteri TaxID=158822 RepID=A0A291DY72_9ENTR|nr:antibiotic biosynthesis monooxygenase [Cedecea neteri]ATF92754.1 antibiotic biosynthesis monooxygenase [Cedecea neteri]SQC93534.1 Antibiotic biosynthesis monooxygenase [Cedecea neteri]